MTEPEIYRLIGELLAVGLLVGFGGFAIYLLRGSRKRRKELNKLDADSW